MKYKNHLAFLDREIASLGTGLHLDFESLQRVMGGPGTREADDACRVFAATLEWPLMSDAVRAEVCCRLACGRWWCADMGEVEIGPEEDGQWMLEQLLIDYWLDAGREEWIFHSFVERKPE